MVRLGFEEEKRKNPGPPVSDQPLSNSFHKTKQSGEENSKDLIFAATKLIFLTNYHYSRPKDKAICTH